MRIVYLSHLLMRVFQGRVLCDAVILAALWLLLIPVTATGQTGHAFDASMYFGRNGIPARLTVSTEKFGVKFRDSATTTSKQAALSTAAGVGQLTPEHLDALAQPGKTAVIDFAPGLSNADAKSSLDQIRAMDSVEEARPVYVIAPGIEEMETELLYVSVPLPHGVAKEDVEAAAEVLFAQKGLEVFKRIDYSDIGKIGYRLKVPYNGADTPGTINKANDLHTTKLSLPGDVTVPLVAAPVFCHLYAHDDLLETTSLAVTQANTATMTPQPNTDTIRTSARTAARSSQESASPPFPDDPLYLATDPHYLQSLQYDLADNDSSSVTGGMNMSGAWNTVYDDDRANGGDFKVKSQFNQADVVIASLDCGVMLDYSGIPSTVCSSPPTAGLPVGTSPSCPNTHICIVGGASNGDDQDECQDLGKTTYCAHPDLKANQWYNKHEINSRAIDPDNVGGDCDGDYPCDYFGWNFVDQNNNPYPDHPVEGAATDARMDAGEPAHATEAMGNADARGNNNEGMTGVCWGAKIMPLKIATTHYTNTKGVGDFYYDINMADAIDYAAKKGANVLALLGMEFTYYPEQEDALLHARKKGCVITVPATNANQDLDNCPPCTPQYPAVLPEVITVGGVNQYEHRCTQWDWGWANRTINPPEDFGKPRGSNYGWAVDVVAPTESSVEGVHRQPQCTGFPSFDIKTATAPKTCTDFYHTGGGTSTAYPHVSGLAALLLTVDGRLSPAEVQATIEWTAKALREGLGPAIILQPSSITVNNYDTVTLSVSLWGVHSLYGPHLDGRGDPIPGEWTDGLKFQWKKDGADIFDSTDTATASFTIPSATSRDAGSYSCEIVDTVYDDHEPITTDAATLTVGSGANTVQILSPPQSSTISQGFVRGDAIVLAVSAAGQGPLCYQWQRNANDISNATQACYVIDAFEQTDEGYYDCRVSSCGGSAHYSGTVQLSMVAPTLCCSQRSRYTGWGLADGSAAVNWAMKNRWAVRNEVGRNVMSIDTDGYLVMDGTIQEDFTGQPGLAQRVSDLAAAGKKFIVKDASGNIMALLDPEWGSTKAVDAQWPTLYMAGRIYAKETELDPPERSFIVRTTEGQKVAYISTVVDTTTGYPAGSLVLKGDVFQGSDPDPQAEKPEIVFWEDFEDRPNRTGPAEFSPDYGTSGPTWEWYTPSFSLSDCSTFPTSDAWDQSNDVLTNQINDECCAIRIARPGADDDFTLDFTVDFMYSMHCPMEIAFRQNDSQTNPECVYLKVKPASTTKRMQLFRSDDNATPIPDGMTTDIDRFPVFAEDNVHEWYQLHIQAAGSRVRVWLRLRGDRTEASGWSDTGQWQAALWTLMLDATDDRTLLDLGSQAYFSINVESGTYSFDNIAISKRQTAPSGDGPCN